MRKEAIIRLREIERELQNLQKYNEIHFLKDDNYKRIDKSINKLREEKNKIFFSEKLRGVMNDKNKNC